MTEEPKPPAFKRPWVLWLLFGFIGLTFAIYFILP
jgi:hypothetical protein